MQIEVNGDVIELTEGATLTDLLTQMELTGKRVAVELNLEIIPRSAHPETRLQAGDKVEVVHAIGGG